MSILEIKNISKKYTRRNSRITVLSGVDIGIEKSTFNTIEGESGSGKSTFLGIISGLIDADEGEVIYHKKDGSDIKINSLSADERARLRRHDIVYMSQLQEVIPELTVSENIRLTDVFTHEETSGDTRLSVILERLGLTDIRDEYPCDISGWELRRLVIARTLYSSPEIVLAEEPTNDLDKDNREEIYRIFRDMSERGITVIVATHDKELVEAADNRFLLKDGKLSLIS